ncbi:hypothetical protein ABL78_2535 [Leptomonas seymouri]|uniref:Phosphatidic acid phosphatase type 2/haloperoxidase domain-containing protein n=1 Tax=Leptomonas seymouri TaxID=5684 RepID=A0A0N1I7E3_LEPSE|nr:hypothetical protein ABL78_2535 [Leptomonas seymouri]|eukprot:KPI88360.1 hypothetical protein ABL78_2535 [Leptomonas seymouri]
MPLLSRIDYILDQSCCLIVASAVMIIDVYRVFNYTKSICVPVFIANACITAGLSKVLKRCINHSRPPGARKSSPGMPSNHATVLSFLSVCAVFALQICVESTPVPGLTRNNAWRLFPVPAVPDIPASWVKPLQALLIVYSLYLTRLRVVQGHHTVAQVVVGYLFGTGCAVLCLTANYARYGGKQPGGRVDELSFLMKTVVVAASSLVVLIAARSVFRSAMRGREFASSLKGL